MWAVSSGIHLVNALENVLQARVSSHSSTERVSISIEIRTKVSAGFLYPRRHPLGSPETAHVVTGSVCSLLTKDSKKVAVRVPCAKNLSVIFLMSTRRSPSYINMERTLAED